jgi:hypothetical protein
LQKEKFGKTIWFPEDLKDTLITVLYMFILQALSATVFFFKLNMCLNLQYFDIMVIFEHNNIELHAVVVYFLSFDIYF